MGASRLEPAGSHFSRDDPARLLKNFSPQKIYFTSAAKLHYSGFGLGGPAVLDFELHLTHSPIEIRLLLLCSCGVHPQVFLGGGGANRAVTAAVAELASG
jgi:hypothetical protein